MNYTPPGYQPISAEELQQQQIQQFRQFQQFQLWQQQYITTPNMSASPPAYASPQQLQRYHQWQQQQPHSLASIASPPPYLPSDTQGGYQAAPNPSPNRNPFSGTAHEHPQSSYEDRPLKSSCDRPRSSHDDSRGSSTVPRSPTPPAQRPIRGVYASGPPRERPPPPAGMSSFHSKLKNIAPGESIDALLNPPPPSFLRDPALDMSYAPFEPTALVGPSDSLVKGFGVIVPPWPSARGPHPFSTHDVREEDWERFLGDLKKAANLTGRDKVVAAVVPMVSGAGLGGIFISRAMERGMRSRKRGPAGELVDNWNHYFFRPRRITVTLAQGNITFSGKSDGAAPDVLGGQFHSSSDDSSSSSEDEFESSTGTSAAPHDMSKRDRKKAKRQRKKEEKQREKEEKSRKKEEKNQSKQKKKAEKKSRDEPWRIVISPARPEY